MDIVNFNLRLPEELNDKIIKIAEAEGRSKNKQIEFILKQYVSNYESQNTNISINQSNNNKAVVKFKNN